MKKPTVRDVLLKFHKRVPFPITVKKIKKAGLKPKEYLLEIANAVQKASDLKTSSFKDFTWNLEELLRREKKSQKKSS